MEFSIWLEQQEAWKGKKAEIIRFWRSLEERPIVPAPIPVRHRGSSYSEDGLRLTGTAYFINSVLSRTKDFLKYESPQIELDIDYHQVLDKDRRPIPGKYACYVRLREREKKLRFRM